MGIQVAHAARLAVSIIDFSGFGFSDRLISLDILKCCNVTLQAYKLCSDWADTGQTQTADMSVYKDTSSRSTKVASRLDLLPLEVHHLALDYCMAEAIKPETLSYSNSKSEERITIDADCRPEHAFLEKLKMPAICVVRESCRLADLRRVLQSDNLSITITGFDRHSLEHLWVSTEKFKRLSGAGMHGLDVHLATCTMELDFTSLASWTWYFRYYAPNLSGRFTFAAPQCGHSHHSCEEEAESLLQTLADLGMQAFKDRGIMTEAETELKSWPIVIWDTIRSYDFSSCCKEFHELYHRADDLLQQDLWQDWGYECPLRNDGRRHRNLTKCLKKDQQTVDTESEALDKLCRESRLSEVEVGKFGIAYYWVDDAPVSGPW
ncbi:hypothetical protein C1H76_8061 [Elsinoe australis]|uniref:Uncharacterized protein n=1 Tax=Elsinoe australis TaxID=40998 RepID=A0A4U7AP18_9PEZI|nr:hypothetical protein C1H76_8061 [Elsinoe australis]